VPAAEVGLYKRGFGLNAPSRSRSAAVRPPVQSSSKQNGVGRLRHNTNVSDRFIVRKARPIVWSTKNDIQPTFLADVEPTYICSVFLCRLGCFHACPPFPFLPYHEGKDPAREFGERRKLSIAVSWARVLSPPTYPLGSSCHCWRPRNGLGLRSVGEGEGKRAVKKVARQRRTTCRL